MLIRPVYNLEFPDRCPELKIFGYRFTPIDNYDVKCFGLQHLSSSISIDGHELNPGTHIHTAFVELPDKEEEAILDWSGKNITALMDIVLLLTLFTQREIFLLNPQNDQRIQISREAIIADPRLFQMGRLLRNSIPFKNQQIENSPFGYDIGFEEGINKIYKLMRTKEWQIEYNRGYFLILAKMAFRQQVMESSFIFCWTIWEHLFAILNYKWLSMNQIQQLSSKEKISFLLVKYSLVDEIDDSSRKRIDLLAEIRNRLIHYGRFPERGTIHNEVLLFFQLTEYIIAEALGLSPSTVINTKENLQRFLKGK
jgi:hypothetical protein